jgi:hypothetical protein
MVDVEGSVRELAEIIEKGSGVDEGLEECVKDWVCRG